MYAILPEENEPELEDNQIIGSDGEVVETNIDDNIKK